MSDFLFAIALGPVQGFIAAARKTRDLWYGSQLLSDLARRVALDLQATYGERLTSIFPTKGVAADTGVAVANKLLIGLRDVSPDEVRRRIEATAQGYLPGLLRELLEQPRFRNVQGLDRELLAAQCASFVECYIAWVPYEPDDYNRQRRTVDQLLDGRKMLRNFGPAPGSLASREGQPKSALDPSRESVIRYFPQAQEGAERRNDALASALRVKRGEQLDGISLIKRLHEPRRFVSTARVAIDPLIRRLAVARPDALAQLRALADRLKATPLVEPFAGYTGEGRPLHHYRPFPYDTQLFYGLWEQDEEDALNDEQKTSAREFNGTVQRACRDLGIGEPPAYYALLVADGDKVGTLLDSMATPEDHIAFSEALGEFAAAANGIVAAHDGALVYSGGDDVLAFVPLDRALDCADALRRHFSGLLKDRLDREVTMSAGIAIVHFNEPLHEALEWARAAERAAKGDGPRERNGLAVALHTRSGGGEDTTVVQNWDEGGDDGPVVAYWHRWIALHREDALPDGAAYELRKLAAEFAASPLAPDAQRDLLRREARRILGRKRAEHGARPVVARDEPGDAELRRLAPLLDRLAVADERPMAELRRITDEAIIARRLAQARDIAEGRRADRPAVAGGVS